MPGELTTMIPTSSYALELALVANKKARSSDLLHTVVSWYQNDVSALFFQYHSEKPKEDCLSPRSSDL